jgi:hypothetical protein
MTKGKAKNSVDKVGQIIFVTLRGDQRASVCKETVSRILEVMKKRHSPKSMIVDITQVESVDNGAKEICRRFLTDQRYKRIAVVCESTWLMTVAMMVIRTANVGNKKVKIFTSLERAGRWAANNSISELLNKPVNLHAPNLRAGTKILRPPVNKSA